MSSQNPAKKARLMSKKKNYYKHNGKPDRKTLEVGQRGFLATCNFRESDCVRDSYNLLNQYADKLYGINKLDESNTDEAGTTITSDLDIADELQNDVDRLNDASQKGKKFRFQVVDSGSNNCLFIKTTLPNATELGTTIVKDIAKNGIAKSRHILRFIPIEVVCKANLLSILEAAGPLFDKFFLKGNTTFSIVYNKRYNNDIKRDEIIKELADLVTAKNITNKVDLNNPQLSVIVEMIKGRCCMNVLEDYIKLKKYNLVEIVAAQKSKDVEEDKDSESGKFKCEENLNESPAGTTEGKEEDNGEDVKLEQENTKNEDELDKI